MKPIIITLVELKEEAASIQPESLCFAKIEIELRMKKKLVEKYNGKKLDEKDLKDIIKQRI